MATIGYDYDTIRKAIAVELGFSRTSTDWTTAEAEDIDEVVRHGLLLYYAPPLEQYTKVRHTWSFLTPYYTVNAVAGQEEYTLPSGIIGIPTDVLTIRQASVPDRNIRIVNEAQYRTIRSEAAYCEGYPVAAAFWPNSSDGSAEQTLKLGVWPTPLAGQTFVFQYSAAQTMLDSTHKIPLGMPQYADVFRAACMAAAELKLDDEKGKHWSIYVERALAAIASDRKLMQGRSIGVMNDTDPVDCEEDDWHTGSIDYTVRTIS